MPAFAVALAVLALAGAPAAFAADPVIMAAGDIACTTPGSASPGLCSDLYTSNLARAQLASPEGLAALLAVGDAQYESATTSEYANAFDLSWGRSDLRGLLRPVPGNHEYVTSGAAGYFSAFAGLGVNVGTPGQGWYSYDIGSWHLIALNSSNGCGPVSCASGSPQETWLKADLAASKQPCRLVYWHHPLSTAPLEKPIWQDLYNAGVDFVLTGHVHGYRAPHPINANNAADPNGPREVTVGTGGKDGGTYGLLKMTLHANGASWSFVGTISDSGSVTCHGATPPPPPAPAPPPPPPPRSSFAISTSGLTVSLTDTSTNGPTGWNWDFGDGTGRGAEDPTPNPTHTYAAPGQYRITLTAGNAGGAGTSSQTVTVTAAPGSPGDTGTPGREQRVTVPAALAPAAAALPALTAAGARAAMRRFLSRRLKHWTIRSLTCRALSTTQAACSFRATRRGARTSGSGTLTLRTPGRTVTGRLRVRGAGRHARLTTWTFRTTG